jgi:hypothetical protein
MTIDPLLGERWVMTEGTMYVEVRWVGGVERRVDGVGYCVV